MEQKITWMQLLSFGLINTLLVFSCNKENVDNRVIADFVYQNPTLQIVIINSYNSGQLSTIELDAGDRLKITEDLFAGANDSVLIHCDSAKIILNAIAKIIWYPESKSTKNPINLENYTHKLLSEKHHNLKQLIDFELYLNGIEKYGFGGTCYSINFYLNQLLGWLGFDIKLCGADIKHPDVHLVNIVTLENREFLIDAGYAAPFSEPLPLDLQNDYLIDTGFDKYILKPLTNNGYSKIELYRYRELKHGYRIYSQKRNIAEFQ